MPSNFEISELNHAILNSKNVIRSANETGRLDIDLDQFPEEFLGLLTSGCAPLTLSFIFGVESTPLNQFVKLGNPQDFFDKLFELTEEQRLDIIAASTSSQFVDELSRSYGALIIIDEDKADDHMIGIRPVVIADKIASKSLHIAYCVYDAHYTKRIYITDEDGLIDLYTSSKTVEYGCRCAYIFQNE